MRVGWDGMGWDGEERAAVLAADLAQSVQIEGIVNQNSPGGGAGGNRQVAAFGTEREGTHTCHPPLATCPLGPLSLSGLSVW